jgi:hypothetical protein
VAPLDPPGIEGLKGDEDDDNDTPTSETRSSKSDTDTDFDNDTMEKTGFYDKDDSAMVDWGQEAGPIDARAVETLVKRYHAAAAAASGAKSCALLSALSAEAIPEDYGRGAGPSYSRGTTCSVVLSKLFKHLHRQFISPIIIADVRVQGNRARVMIASTVAPAASLPLIREGGVWKVDGLLWETLP